VNTSRTSNTERNGLVLEGLPGDNPLGFLAALGVLRVLSRRWPDRRVTMGWDSRGGWRPILGRADFVERTPGGEPGWTDAEGLDCLQPASQLTRAEVVEELHAALHGRHQDPEFTLADNGEEPKEIKLSPTDFAAVARASLRSVVRSGDRTWADFCVAYGTDAYGSAPLIRETDLHFTSGQQSFMGTIRALAGDPPRPAPKKGKQNANATSVDTGATTSAQLEHALFEPWSYSDPRPSLRWDPIDDRRYALRAFDPTNAAVSPILTVRGANRLAIEALPWLPTFPCDGGARTRGFTRRNRVVDFTWPIWHYQLSADTVRSLLGLGELYADAPPRGSLVARGIAEVFRCRRIGGYYRNFSPAVACLGRIPSRSDVGPVRLPDAPG
jgi:hypothetical protein